MIVDVTSKMPSNCCWLVFTICGVLSAENSTGRLLPGERMICWVSAPSPVALYRLVLNDSITRSRRKGRISTPALPSVCGALAALVPRLY